MDKAEFNRLLKENKELLEWKRTLSLLLKYSSEITVLDSVKEILYTIANATKEVLQADRCTVFLLDKEKNELYSWVAHGLGRHEIRIPIDKGLAGYVATTGKVLNVKDAYRHKRFNPEIDKDTGYRTTTILGMPMKNQIGRIIGIFQVLNKNNGVFTGRDEEILRLLSQQAAAAIESTQLYEEITRSFTSFINTLAETIDARDPMTAGHSQRVCRYSILMAEKMGYTQEKIEVLKYAALLHDLGKIGVKEAILTKSGQLTEEEFIHIQTHTRITRKILERTYLQPRFKDIPVVASSHHEKMDGSGYPDKLKGRNIPKMARIMAVADVFDAITYRRHYREPMSMSKVISELRKDNGKKFDIECVNALLNTKVYDILSIMTEGTEKEISVSDRDKFNSMLLEELGEMLDNGTKDGVVKEFRKYYPVQRSEV